MKVFASFFLLTALVSATSSAAVTIDTVPVGNPGNANDPDTGNRYGGVGYKYSIGKYEVTVGQYTEFLNAVAKTDTYGLYNPYMTTWLNTAGITQSCASGCTYSEIGSPNHPMAFVSWGDAARFANWLHNGQPTGAQNASTTEDGAYKLNGATSNSAFKAVSRNANAKWFIPSESEWYKAAYHQPAAQGGDSDNYWYAPMRSNSEPYSDQPPGATPDNTRVGNFYSDDSSSNDYNDGYAVTALPYSGYSDLQNYLTDVGAYTSSPSFYGTFDQGGNVREWTETVAGTENSSRVVRGGDWNDNFSYLYAGYRDYFFPANGFGYSFGFRVASIPEPNTLQLLCFGSLAVLWRRRRLVCASSLAVAVGITCADRVQAVTIDTVPVGIPGNANDPATGNLYGGVGYAYNIGKYEVTVGQYTAFLNAVASTDTYNLYNPAMASDANIAGIAQSCASVCTYSVIGSPLHPVTYVNWGDAARFANWLHNGQPSGAEGPGTTETGAYTLNGAVSIAALMAVARSTNATWFIPTENEWYKAAYHQPAAQGGDSDNYWAYPMKTNSVPYSDQPPGATPNNTRVGNFYLNDSTANGYNDGYAVTGSTSYSSSQNYLTDVGAYTSSPSFYGTFDQGGNVYEWNETAYDSAARGGRGDFWFGNSNFSGDLSSSNRNGFFANNEDFGVGFRVASIPEPSTLLLTTLASLGLAATLAIRTKRSRRLSHE